MVVVLESGSQSVKELSAESNQQSNKQTSVSVYECQQHKKKEKKTVLK